MSADAPCPLCVRKFNPHITTTELMAIGASVSEMCSEHQASVDRFNTAVAAVDGDKRLADALARLGSAGGSAAISVQNLRETMNSYNSKLIDLQELRESIRKANLLQ